jgi:hypothetical protein
MYQSTDNSTMVQYFTKPKITGTRIISIYIPLYTSTCQREIEMGVFYLVMFPVDKIVWRLKSILYENIH